MKAPDKIYVLLDKTSGFLSHTFTNIPCNYGGSKQDIEYIRKDYLLEWAKGEQNKCSDETHPYAMFMNVVINKLNEI